MSQTFFSKEIASKVGVSPNYRESLANGPFPNGAAREVELLKRFLSDH
jgi:hypothetical protein